MLLRWGNVRTDLDALGGATVSHIHNIINVVAHSHEQIKEQFATILHFHLHRAAALERPPAADNESKVMSAEARVTVWCILVRVPSATEDGANLDSALQALLAQGEPLELLKAVPFRRAVHGSVTENNVTYAGVKYCRLNTPATTRAR